MDPKPDEEPDMSEDDEDYQGDEVASGNDGSDDSDEDDSSDDGDEDEDDDDEDEEEKIAEAKKLQDHLLDNPYDYDQHLKLIEMASQIGDLNMLRKARESMASKFPLTPSLWLDWIRLEKEYAETESDKTALIELFERALKDYVSVQLWLEYIYFVVMIPDDESNVTRVRDVCERAIASVGLHVVDGASVWIAYRTFESGIIELLEPKEVVHQYKRIFELFKRQLSVPFIGMEETLQEFHVWFEKASSQCPGLDLDPNSIKYGYDQAHALLQKLEPFEQELSISEPPHYQEYLKYIEYEEANGTPARVQCIYERSLLENCLQPELWIKYTQYYDTKINELAQVIPLHERAVRNCLWTVGIWTNYLRSLERNKADHETVLPVFERSIQVTFQSGKDYLDLWLTYLDYLRRRTGWNDENQVTQLRKNFATAIEHLSGFADGDEACTIPLYMATIEAKYIKNMREARRIWNELFQSRKDLTASVTTWIEYANFEKIYGDSSDVKKALIKGLNSNVEYPETIGGLLIKHAREESNSIMEVDEVMKIYEKVMARVTAKREEAARKKQEEKASKAKPKAYDGKRKRPAEQDGTFKVPEQPPTKLNKLSDDPKGKHPSKMSVNAVKDEKILKEMERQASFKEKGDDERKLNTIVVKNLKYSVLEDKLREVFSKFGEIVDIRLVRNYKGLSAGYGFIEFVSISSVKEALKHDRLLIEDRPCFIDEMGKKNAPQFSTGRENNKLFVSSLDKQATTDQLSSIFGIYGVIKDIRIGTAKNGKPKGYAYIEYKSERDANEALAADGTIINNKPIKVQISDPSARNTKPQTKFLGSGLMQPSTSTISAKRRINVPTSMIPPAVRKRMLETDKPSTSSSKVNGDEMDT